MGEVVYKYQLSFGKTTLKLPLDAKFLHLGEQEGTVCVWVLQPAFAPVGDRTVMVVGTGREFEEVHSYIGTTQVGPYVWHAFEVK